MKTATLEYLDRLLINAIAEQSPGHSPRGHHQRTISLLKSAREIVKAEYKAEILKRPA